MHAPPPFDARLTAWERTAAHAVHGLLYVTMLATPLTGWALISANQPRPEGGPLIWGLFHLPTFSTLSQLEATARKSVHDSFVEAHSVIGWITLGLLALHVAAALKHQFFDRHAEFARMGLGTAE